MKGEKEAMPATWADLMKIAREIAEKHDAYRLSHKSRGATHATAFLSVSIATAISDGISRALVTAARRVQNDDGIVEHRPEIVAEILTLLNADSLSPSISNGG